MFKRIDHVELIASDIERSLGFYTEVLGFTLQRRVKLEGTPLREVAFLALGDTVLEIQDVEGAAPAEEAPRVGYCMMALEVENMQEALDYLASKGIQPAAEPMQLGRSLRAEIRDPDGLGIELRQW